MPISSPSTEMQKRGSQSCFGLRVEMSYYLFSFFFFFFFFIIFFPVLLGGCDILKSHLLSNKHLLWYCLVNKTFGYVPCPYLICLIFDNFCCFHPSSMKILYSLRVPFTSVVHWMKKKKKRNRLKPLKATP